MMPRYRAWDKEFKEMVQVNALVLDEQGKQTKSLPRSVWDGVYRCFKKFHDT